MKLQHTLMRLALAVVVPGGMLMGCVSGQHEPDAVSQTIPQTYLNQADSQATDQNPAGAYSGFTFTPTAPVDEPVQIDECMVGTWEVQDLHSAISESFGHAQTDLSLQAVEGQTLYEFSEAGEVKISFIHLGATFSGSVDGTSITAYQSLDGSAVARYQIDDVEGVLVMSDFGGEGIFSALDINDQRLAEGNFPAWQAFTSGLSNGMHIEPTPLVDYSRVKVTCSGDHLTLQADEPYSGPRINLTRFK